MDGAEIDQTSMDRSDSSLKDSHCSTGRESWRPRRGRRVGGKEKEGGLAIRIRTEKRYSRRERVGKLERKERGGKLRRKERGGDPRRKERGGDPQKKDYR